MGVDQRVVDGDFGVERADVADTTHVGGEVIDLVDILSAAQALVVVAQVRDLKFIRRRALVLGIFEIGATDDISVPDKILDKVMSDKTARARYQRGFPISHFASPLADRKPACTAAQEL